MRRLPRPLIAALVLVASAASAAGALQARPIGRFAEPVYVTAPPGDVHRVFVVERRGTIKVVEDGRVRHRLFLDITRRVSQPAGLADERGLLSMAFAPDYATSGRFYVYYPRRRGRRGDLKWAVVEEYRSGGDGAVVADSRTRRGVMAIPTGHMHFGGQLAFGPDGRLWLGPGDGRGPGDPDRQSQNRHTLRGKLLRIDPRPGRPLAPSGNPWRRRGAPLVWAYGLRNPFRFSFDRLTGDLVLADVGQNFVEEIDFVPRAAGLGRGANFGWSRLEGRFVFDEATSTRLRRATRSQLPARYVPPAVEHLHRRGWCAVIGGYLVRDPALPELVGRYLYGDFCRGEIVSVHLIAPGRAGRVRPTGLHIELLTSFGEDGCGRVYATSLRGPVFRLADSGRCAGAAPTPFAVPASARPAADVKAAVVGAWAVTLNDPFGPLVDRLLQAWEGRTLAA